MVVSAETQTQENNTPRLRLFRLLFRPKPIPETPPEPTVEELFYAGLTEPEKITYDFVTEFSRMVHDLDIKQVMIPVPDRPPSKNLDAFSLISLVPRPNEDGIPWCWPIMKRKEGRDIDSLDHVGTGFVAEPRHRIYGNAYLDSSVAIGLGYGNELEAIAAGGLWEPDQVRIVQIQGVKASYDPGSPHRSFYKNNGLNAGFLWRESLVKAWHELSREHGIRRLEIQGARNNRYWTPEDYIERDRRYRFDTEQAKRINASLIKGYDQLAERMGFEPTPDGNWVTNVN